MRVIACITLTSVASLCTTLAAAQAPTRGPAETWVGAATLGDSTWYFEVRLTRDSAGVRGSVDLPLRGTYGVALAEVGTEAGRLRFAIPRRHGDTLRFDGPVSGSEAAGAVQYPSGPGTFRALRLRPDTALAHALAGNYQVGARRVLTLGEADDGRVIYFDSETRRVGYLSPAWDSTWIAGPSAFIAFPAVTRVGVARDTRGRVRGLVWRGPATTLHAERLADVREESATFRGGGVLAGTLTIPRTPGRHPAIVLVHGSGPQSRRDFHFFRNYLAHHGVAVLAYDKRGVGGSAGDWRTATFEDLAADALAGVRLLRARSDVDPRRVGVMAWSNGAWVAPLVAARAPGEIAFVIAGAASGLTNGENIAYEVENDLREAGFGPADVTRGVALRQFVTRFVIDHPTVSAAAWDTLASTIDRARGERWFGAARVAWALGMAAPPDTATLATLRAYRASWRLDPVPAWEQVRCPTLVLLGAFDNAVPAAESARRIRAALTRGGNRAATVRVHPRGSHALFEVPTAAQADVQRATRYVPGHPAELVAWLAVVSAR